MSQTPNWTLIKSGTAPLGREYHAMAYDFARQRTVLFGGFSNPAYLRDTWEWDGASWTLRKPAAAPSARRFHAMAYDSARRRTVLFGGDDIPGSPRDTWEWDGVNWTKITTANAPAGPCGIAMAYDSARGRTVLFGGAAICQFPGSRSETWEYDGKNWIILKPTTSPSARTVSAMAFDATRRRTVLFGGGDFRGRALADTWEWNGSNWTKKSPTTLPPGRERHAMVYDQARQRVVMHGGWNGTLLSDTWEYDGLNWTQITPTTSPLARRAHAMAYDAARQRTVLFAGSYFSDFWGYGINTLTLTANTPTIPTNGGTQAFTLNAGTDLKNKSYWIFGSATSTMPGVVLTGIHIPLRPDLYTDIVISTGNSKEFTNFRGKLGATGTATASLNVPANLPIPPGFKLYHSYVVYDGTTGRIYTSSNPVSVEFK